MIIRAWLLCLLSLSAATSSMAQSSPSFKREIRKKVPTIEYGTASFYAKKFQGLKTGSGELYDSKKMTAAHNHLPFGTWICVTNLKNNRKVFVRVNDRLHHRNTRIVDLSYSAASKLGYIGRGLAKVRVEVLGMKKPKTGL